MQKAKCKIQEISLKNPRILRHAGKIFILLNAHRHSGATPSRGQADPVEILLIILSSFSEAKQEILVHDNNTTIINNMLITRFILFTPTITF